MSLFVDFAPMVNEASSSDIIVNVNQMSAKHICSGRLA